MSDYKSLTKEQCADILLGIDRALVLCHVRPDGDTVGSAKALAELLRAMGKEAKITCADPIPERLKFILDENDLLVGSREGYTPISIDVASPSQLGSLAEELCPVVAIDHHASSTPFADNYTVKDTSSAAEALMDVIEHLEERGVLCLNSKIAAALYTAISSDSGCFCYSSVTPRTHLRAARLIGTGIDFSDINRRLFHTKSPEQIAAESFVGSRIRTVADGRIAYALITEADRLALGVGKEHFECAIDVVRTLAGVEIAITVKEAPDGAFKASLRSVGANVAEIAAAFGGGGHIRAAGCTLHAESITDAAALLLAKARAALN